MIRIRTPLVPTLLLAATVALAPGAIRAQTSAPPAAPGAAASADDHAAHHPSDKPAAPSGPAGAAGMMGGDMGVMMQQMMPMMRAMMAREAAGRMDGPMAMMAPRRVEGRIAFLRTELAITDAQGPAWNAFADALRAQARAMEALRGAAMGDGPGKPMAGMPMGGMPDAGPRPGGTGSPMMGTGRAALPFPEQANRLVDSLSARLEAARSIAAAGRTLYGVLTEAQKETADELLAIPMRGM